MYAVTINNTGWIKKLKGGKELITKYHVPFVVLEFSPAYLKEVGSDPKELAQFFVDNGYKISLSSFLSKDFISVDELLNGLESERPKVTLSYDWKKFEEGDVDMTGMGYDIFLGADGVVGIKGSRLLKSKEAIKSFIAEIEEQLTIGYEAQERRGAIKETKHD